RATHGLVGATVLDHGRGIGDVPQVAFGINRVRSGRRAVHREYGEISPRWVGGDDPAEGVAAVAAERTAPPAARSQWGGRRLAITIDAHADRVAAEVVALKYVVGRLGAVGDLDGHAGAQAVGVDAVVAQRDDTDLAGAPLEQADAGGGGAGATRSGEEN